MVLIKGERSWRWVVGNDMATNVTWEFCPYCKCDLGDLLNSKVYTPMTTCPHCNGRLEDTPVGPYCEPCRCYVVDDLDDEDPGPALPMRDEYAFGDDSIRTPYGRMSGLPRDRGRFDI